MGPRPRLGPLTRLALFAVLALGVESLGPSCSSGLPIGPIRAFNRPVAVAFVCFETATGNPVPTAQCALVNGVTPTGFSMHALVSQETRGEVAAVDLIARTVLDSDRRVPGYSFVPVGSLPGAIVVPPEHPACTYVANRGTNDISVLHTRRFRASTSGAFDTFADVPLPGSPTDMVLESDESALWVALAEMGMVVRLPIVSECELAEADLMVDLGDGSAIPLGVPAFGSVDLARTCPTSFVPVPAAALAPREPEVDPATLAAPASLAIDDEARVLLVGDRALPLIHRVSLDDGTVLAPIATGAPIRDLVVTPRVPDTYEPSSTATSFSRYLYAIDENDSTVMAIEYSDETRADFGAVIPVDVAGADRPDRIRMDAGARALEVLTPGYDEALADPRADLCDVSVVHVTTPGPTFLRGVFVSVAGADGSIRFVDVYDLDAPCRGRQYGLDPSDQDCSTPTIASDIAVYIRRHRPRGSSFLLAFGGVTQQPSVILGAATIPLLPDGTAGPEPTTVPRLLDLMTCPAHLSRVLGEASGATVTSTRVCGLTDPFAVLPETWSAAWEGSIPGTGTSGANAGAVSGGTVTIDAPVDYCQRGVIGSDDAVNGLPADAPENGYLGDQLAITGALPAGQIERALCRAVVGVTTIGEPQLPVRVPILRAFSDPDDIERPYTGRLVVDVTAPLAGRQPFAEGDATPRDLTILDALDCYGDQLLTVDVRARGAYAVLGGRSGFAARVARDDTDGHCVWDATMDVLAQGRAFASETYVNERIAFAVSAPVTGNPDLRIVMSTTQNPLGIDLTVSTTAVRQISLPSALSWSEAMARLYTVDMQRRGLVELTVLPIGVSATRFE